jgi:hypothetical protein
MAYLTDPHHAIDGKATIRSERRRKDEVCVRGQLFGY